MIILKMRMIIHMSDNRVVKSRILMIMVNVVGIAMVKIMRKVTISELTMKLQNHWQSAISV